MLSDLSARARVCVFLICRLGFVGELRARRDVLTAPHVCSALNTCLFEFRIVFMDLMVFMMILMGHLRKRRRHRRYDDDVPRRKVKCIFI